MILLLACAQAPTSHDHAALEQRADELQAELAALRARVEELEGAELPSPPDGPRQDWLTSHGGTRSIQLDGQVLRIVGEQAHGLDWYAPGDFWYCSFGEAGDAPLLSFLLRESTVEHHAEADWYPPGLGEPYTQVEYTALARLDPLPAQQTTTNEVSGEAGQHDAYALVDSSELDFFLYQPTDDRFYIAVMGHEALDGEGDGTDDRDNGVRIDIAFSATLDLPDEKLALLEPLDDDSEAYPTEHPHSF